MPHPSFRVFAYSPNAFVDIISEISGSNPDFLKSKTITRYFHEYFSHSGINAKTVIAEYDYVDHDYLADYVGYYSRCFTEYKRYCTRLHFFSAEFTSEEFGNLLKDFNSNSDLGEKLKGSYCGFIVVKPLPQRMIGKTCLKTYPTDSSESHYKRHYVTARSYEANLFGISLTVENSLAFQEQDSVAAACATSALWSVFQATGRLFQHTIPSPIEITLSATALPDRNRPIPNQGLYLEQMVHAVRKLGLEAYCEEVNHQYVFKAEIYAFIKCEIPVTLAIGLFDCHKVTANNKNDYILIGGHAVAITGYNLNNSANSEVLLEDNTTLIKLKSSKIEKLYVHDDGVGPYARMEFDNIPVKLPGNADQKSWSLSTSWPYRAVPTDLLFSIPPKIRVAFKPNGA